MPHDRKGKILKAGDFVLIPAIVTDIQAGEDFCNVTVETCFGRRPDDHFEKIHAINTGVMLRANLDDDVDLQEIHQDTVNG